VVTVPHNKGNAFISLLVRILGETVVVERDQNDKPLVDALAQAGIPRSKIILAYAGEAVPESA
jgi:sulfur carrier protein ThiS